MANPTSDFYNTSTYKEHIDISYQDFPKIPTRLMKGYDIMATGGAFYFFIPYMVLFLITVNEILLEKERKLRNGVCVMGLTHNAYWMSWICFCFIMEAILTIMQILSGTLF